MRFLGCFVFPTYSCLLSSVLTLQDLIEKVVILRKAVQQTQVGDANAVGILLAEKMSQYANLLASQGNIAAALAFLPTDTNQVNELKCAQFFTLAFCWMSRTQEGRTFFPATRFLSRQN